MKKTYEKPELHVEPFDAEDVITASDNGNLLAQVGRRFEGMIDNFVDMVNSLGS